MSLAAQYPFFSLFGAVCAVWLEDSEKVTDQTLSSTQFPTECIPPREHFLSSGYFQKCSQTIRAVLAVKHFIPTFYPLSSSAVLTAFMFLLLTGPRTTGLMRLSLHECIMFFSSDLSNMGIFCLQYFLREENPFLPKMVLTVPAPLANLWAGRKAGKKQKKEYLYFLLFLEELSGGNVGYFKGFLKPWNSDDKSCTAACGLSCYRNCSGDEWTLPCWFNYLFIISKGLHVFRLDKEGKEEPLDSQPSTEHSRAVSCLFLIIFDTG